MSLDKAGNYIFNVEGIKFRVQKMNVFEQREFIGKTKGAFNDAGYIDLYTDSANAAQDWLFDQIFHPVDDSETSWKPLNKGYLPIFLGKQKIKPLVLMNTIFVQVLSGMLGNFTDAGEENYSQNSEAQPVESTSNDDSMTPLQRTLSK